MAAQDQPLDDATRQALIWCQNKILVLPRHAGDT